MITSSQAYVTIAQTKSGMRIHDMPGARMLWTVTTRLIAPASEAIDRMCSDRIQRSWPCPGECSVLSGDVRRPAAPAGPPFAKKLSHSTIPPNRNSQYESAFSRGNAMSRAPIISGTR